MNSPTAEPEVSFILSAFNSEGFLEACLNSIWSQSFRDLEVVAIDDGSTDGTAEILAHHAAREPRLRVLTNDKNIGLTRSLNKGLDHSRGRLVARIDADDECLPDRVMKQRNAFVSDPDLVLVGTNVIMFDADGVLVGYTDLPQDDASIRAFSLLQNPFAHPTVMMRRRTLIDNGLTYDTSYKTTQDWDLWSRLMMYGRVANLPDVLLRQTMMHHSSITMQHRGEQKSSSLRVQQSHAQRLLGTALCSTETYDAINTLIFSADMADNPTARDGFSAGNGFLDAYKNLCAVQPSLATRRFRRWIVGWGIRELAKNLTRKDASIFMIRLIREHAIVLFHAAFDLAWAKLNKRI